MNCDITLATNLYNIKVNKILFLLTCVITHDCYHTCWLYKNNLPHPSLYIHLKAGPQNWDFEYKTTVTLFLRNITQTGKNNSYDQKE